MYFRSAAAAFTCFLGGVLIDADHLFDYYANNGFTLKARNIYDACCGATGLKKLYLILHSYELLTIFWMVICVMSLGDLWIALAIGMTQHIVVDTMTNPLNPFGYMLTYRIKKGFKKEYILRNGGKETGCLL